MKHQALRRLAAALLPFSILSCSKDILRVPIVNTVWEYSASETQTARFCFTDDEHVSLLQHILSDGRIQVSNGVYIADGHNVECHGANGTGSTVKLIRTLSHLKTGTKNLTPMGPKAHDSLCGSIWSTIAEDKLQFCFFLADGQCYSGTFTNMTSPLAGNAKWSGSEGTYTLNGNQLGITVGFSTRNATLYRDVMVVDSLGVLNVSPAVTPEGRSDYSGTVWAHDGDVPAVIVFTAPGHFTRISRSSGTIFIVREGSYTEDEDLLTLKQEGLEAESVSVSGSTLTYLKDSYRRLR